METPVKLYRVIIQRTIIEQGEIKLTAEEIGTLSDDEIYELSREEDTWERADGNVTDIQVEGPEVFE
jgi:hypothetical protein